jgi:hypothetical protein
MELFRYQCMARFKAQMLPGGEVIMVDVDDGDENLRANHLDRETVLHAFLSEDAVVTSLPLTRTPTDGLFSPIG